MHFDVRYHMCLHALKNLQVREILVPYMKVGSTKP